MPDSFSSLSSIADKISSSDIAAKVKDGLGSISTAAASGAGSVQNKLTSLFEVKGFQKPVSVPTTASNPQAQIAKFNTGGGTSGLIFPAEMKYYTMFSFHSYKRAFANESPTKKPRVVICLPMPPNLQETFSVDYDTPSLGPIFGSLAGTALEEARKTGATPLDVLKNIKGQVEGGYKELAQAAIQKGLTKVTPAGETLATVTALAAGAVPNPHMAVVFRNVGLREHTFQYRLAPQSKAELNKLKEIVKELKTSCLPGLSDQTEALFTFPDTCEIKFMPGMDKPYIIKECVMTNLSVNYAPQGSPAFFTTGDPVMVEISMSFKEMSVFTRNDLDMWSKEGKNINGF